MKTIAFFFVLTIALFGVSVKALPSSWPLVNKIQERMAPNIMADFSFNNIKHTLLSGEGKQVYLVVGECNALFFPGEAPRLAVGNTGGLRRIQRWIKRGTFIDADNVAVFWGVGNICRHESSEAIEAEIGKVTQIVRDTYPNAKVLIVSPYDVIAVTQLGPEYRKRVKSHLSYPEGYTELIKRIPELRDFVIGNRRNPFLASNES